MGPDVFFTTIFVSIDLYEFCFSFPYELFAYLYLFKHLTQLKRLVFANFTFDDLQLSENFDRK